MHDYLRRSDRSWRVKKNQDDTDSKLTGYRPSSREKQEGEQPHQRMQMENSYGQMSLGISKSGNMTFVVSGKKQKDETPVFEDQKEVHGDKAARENRWVYSGNRGASESVVLYRAKITSQREKVQMIERFRMLMENEPSEMVQLQMPFLSAAQDRKQANSLEELSKQARSQGKQKEAREYDLHREVLAQDIRMKRDLHREVMRNLTASIKEERQQVKKSGFTGLWRWLMPLAADQAQEDQPPVDDEKNPDDNTEIV